MVPRRLLPSREIAHFAVSALCNPGCEVVNKVPMIGIGDDSARMCEEDTGDLIEATVVSRAKETSQFNNHG